MTPAAIKQWRDSLKLNQRDAAKALGVSTPTYQSWELGYNLQTKQPLSEKIMQRAEMHIRDFTDKSKSS